MKTTKQKAQRIHPRRLIKVTAPTMNRDLRFWLPIILRAEAEGRIKAGSTNSELRLLLA